MFYPASRVKATTNGLYFYEKDILLCEYVLTDNAQVEVEAVFSSPGLGVAFMEAGNNPLDPDRGFLVKIGYNDCLILQKSFEDTITLKHSSCLLAPVKNSTTKITFCKEGQKISVRQGGREIGSAEMPHAMDEFRFGIYSNAGNTIRKATVYLDAPNEWLSEINNTNGGILYFKKNRIEILNGEHEAEVECTPITLEPGRYYLNGTFTGEVTPYVFSSNSEEEEDQAKNILEGDAFTIEEAGEYSFKIKATHGTAENISISTDKNSAFVSTVSGGKTINGSCLVFKLDGVRTIQWTGVINTVQDGDYAIVETTGRTYLLTDFDLELEQSYDYELDVETMVLQVNGEEATIALSQEDNGELKAFRNINGRITNIQITDDTGEISDILLQATHKAYVPADTNAPVIIVNKDSQPFDLSSSYRAKIEDGIRYYLFTNYEREVFNPKAGIVPEKAINEKNQDIKMYGIRTGSARNEDAIYDIEREDNIRLYAPQYELIATDKYEYKDGKIEIDDSVKEYEEVVLDYLKDNSYCINYSPELNSYEIDISSSDEEFYLLTDSGEKPYYITQIKPNSSKFIVLARED